MSKSLSWMAIAVAIALALTLSLTVMASDPTPQSEKETGLLEHIHQMFQRMHGIDPADGRARHSGGGQHMRHISMMLHDLDLTPEQGEKLMRVHHLMGALHSTDDAGDMLELHEKLMGQVENGTLDIEPLQALIDRHVEQIRLSAYETTQDMVELINSLDDEQRQKLMQHVQALEQAGGIPQH